MKRNYFFIAIFSLAAIFASCTHQEGSDTKYVFDNQTNETVTVFYTTLERAIPHNTTWDTIPAESGQFVINAGENATLHLTDTEACCWPNGALAGFQIVTASGDTLHSLADPVIDSDWVQSYIQEDVTSYTWFDHWTYTYIIKK